MAHNLEQALRLMEAALTECPDDLWQADLWPDEAPTAPAPHGGLHGSAPWFLGYYVLEHASQIRRFRVAAAGVTVQPMPGDRGYTG